MMLGKQWMFLPLYYITCSS